MANVEGSDGADAVLKATIEGAGTDGIGTIKLTELVMSDVIGSGNNALSGCTGMKAGERLDKTDTDLDTSGMEVAGLKSIEMGVVLSDPVNPSGMTMDDRVLQKKAVSKLGGGDESAVEPVNTNNHPELFVPTRRYAPVIAMPPLVEINEFEDTVLFEVPGKLYVYESSPCQWKEIGVGVLKLVEDSVKKFKIVFIRSKVYTTGCNHYISDTKIDFARGRNNYLTWSGFEWAINSEEGVLQKFLCQFDREGQAECAEFKRLVEDKVELMKKTEQEDAAAEDTEEHITPPMQAVDEEKEVGILTNEPTATACCQCHCRIM